MRRLLLLLPLVLTGCPKKPDAGADAAASASADAAPSASMKPVNAKIGCFSNTPGGHVLVNKLDPGTTTIAAAKGKALVVNSVYNDAKPVDAGDALEESRAERVTLGTDASPDGPMQPITDPHEPGEPACCPLTWAAATTYGGDVATVSLGTVRFAAAGCAGGNVAVRSGNDAPTILDKGWCRFATDFAAAGKGNDVIAIANGMLTSETKPVAALDSMKSRAGGKAKTHRVSWVPKPGKIEAPAVAIGSTWSAVVFRVVYADGTKDVEAAHIAADGTAEKSVVLAKGEVGAPTIAFDGDTAHIVWAQKRTKDAPWILEWTKWSGAGQPPPSQQIRGGSLPAFAPSLAIGGGQFFLAWMEGDDKLALVRAGASTVNILGAATHATTVSSPNVNARDPEVATDGTTKWVVWQQFGRGASSPRPSAELRTTTITCVE
jgi:hypothetical protein